MIEACLLAKKPMVRQESIGLMILWNSTDYIIHTFLITKITTVDVL